MTTQQKIRQIERRAELAEMADNQDTIELNAWLEELRIQAGPHRPITLEHALADLADDYPLNCSDYVC